ncbi:hypothetical protein BGZ54_003539 [Gamsiella multidivaricata]|nr:hypothetical protein BGZ54_003539 [Gamsiella multidivaricata]
MIPLAPDRVWATYLSNHNYVLGCLVLAYSLRKVRSRYPLVVMVPLSPPLDPEDLRTLENTSNIAVKSIDISIWGHPKCVTATAQEKPEYLWDYYAHTWAKMGAWGLVEYRRVVLLDCDMLVRLNMDQLLNDRAEDQKMEEEGGMNERKVQLGYADATLDLPEGWVAAAHACTCNPMQNPKYPASWTPDSCAYSQYVGNPCPPSHNHPQTQVQVQVQEKKDHISALAIAGGSHRRSYFNSGLVVLTPSSQQLNQILTAFNNITSLNQYLFPDQDLLNEVFAGRWIALGYGYNALKTLPSAHSPIWKEDLAFPPFELKDKAAVIEDTYWSSTTTTPNTDTCTDTEIARPSVMPVVNIHYILEKPWDVKDLEKARQESNRFVNLYRWWWQAHDELMQETKNGST